MSLTRLQYRILEISWKHRLSHIGSCLGSAAILDGIYAKRGPNDPVILSAGHGALGLYCILEKHLGKDAEDLFMRHGVHPNRNVGDEIDCSTGSLGMGVSVAVGRALADRSRNVWCVISDGELSEGAAMESLCFANRAQLTNLHVHLNANGYSACREVLWSESVRIARDLLPSIQVTMARPDSYGIPFLAGLSAHYRAMSDQDWAWVQSQEIEDSKTQS